MLKKIIFIVFLIFGKTLLATQLEELSDIRIPLLTESVPFSFTPLELKNEDFEIILSKSIKQITKIEIEKNSIEWVRVGNIIMLPRARLNITFSNKEISGIIESAGYIQTISNGTISIPVALISGASNKINLKFSENNKEYEETIQIKYSPSYKNPNQIILDSTCSKFNISINNLNLEKNSWAYLGCRNVYTQGNNKQIPSVEIYLIWDNIENSLEINKISNIEKNCKHNFYQFRIKEGEGKINLRSNKGTFEINYFIQTESHKGAINGGLGPYQYNRVQDGYRTVGQILPMFTLYASYSMNESTRFVGFSAIQIHNYFYADTGLYVLTEQIRALDDRFSFNLLLGAHVIALKNPEQNKVDYAIGGPQGLEFVFRDLVNKKYNGSIGAFIYPLINNKSYYNIWARYGKGAIFVELNFISWQEKIRESKIYSRSGGVTVGFPLFQFF